jgi:hypothetical protein
LCASDEIEKNEMGGACRSYGGKAYKVFWWKKRPLGRLRRRWEYNIKMNLQNVGCGGMDWIDVAQDRDR